MKDTFCIMCDGLLEGEEILVGFCSHCEAAMLDEILEKENAGDQEAI